MGDCSSTSNCNPCGPDFNAINQLASRTAVYARQANTYATNAENAAADAEDAWLEFNALYLGAFASAPTTDNEGDPLQIGALYWNSSSNQLFTWNGLVWVLTGFNEFTNFLSTGSTAPRNLVSRTADIVNVKDFGAIGDGIANDTAAIQAALTYAAANNKVVLIPGGIFSINAVIQANVRVIFEGVLKCGYDSNVAGIHLRAQPFKITDYFMQYCNGVYASVNAQGGSGGDLNMGRAALQAAVNDWLRNKTYFTLDLEGRRVVLNNTINIDADLVQSIPGDFEQRRFFSNGKLTAHSSMAGLNKAMLELISTSGTFRSEYIGFSNIALEGAGHASGLRCLNQFYGINFNNCYSRNPENFALYFQAPVGQSGADVQISNCHFVGNAASRTMLGIVYNGNDMHMSNTVVAYHEINLSSTGGNQSIVSNCHFYGTPDNGASRRMPNIKLSDARWTTINGCYIDGGPIQMYNTSATIGYITVVGCFFVVDRPAGYNFVEIETTNPACVAQKIQISLNKFYQINTSQVITNPFQAYGAGLSNSPGDNDENFIENNEFLWVNEQSSEILRSFNLSASTSNSQTPPISRSPFGIPFARIKWFVPEFNANPGGLWFTGSSPTWTVNTENAVTGTVRTLFTINNTPTNP